MKRKKLRINVLPAFLISVGIFSAPVVAASNTWHLDETFASGATFSGDLTFDSNFDNLLSVTGLLSGGGYGNVPITWTWWAGTLQAPVIHYTGDLSTSQDWLMSGTPGIPTAYTTPGFPEFDGTAAYDHFIGISWLDPSPTGKLVLDSRNLWFYSSVLNNESGHSAVFDAVVDAVVSPIPESESYLMLLAGLGLLGFTLRHRKFEKTRV